MSGLPTGYEARAWDLEDVSAVATLMNAYALRVSGREQTTAESLAAQMKTPGLDLSSDARLVVGPGRDVVAVGFVVDLSDPHVQVQSLGMVRREDQGRGIGSWIADWIEQRARRAIDQAPEHARVTVMQAVDDRDESARRLLDAHGYRVVRHFWRMVVELGDQGPAAEWPAGIRVTGFDPEADLRPAFIAGRDAFSDHWGHVDTSQEAAFERFRHRVISDPDRDPDLWFLARDEDDIGGVCYASPREGTDPTSGYIQTLGVRRPWRRRGVALALLLHAFEALRGRGRQRCALHVDSESLTGATRVYEKAGMRVAELNHAYEKELRSGIDLAKRHVASA